MKTIISKQKGVSLYLALVITTVFLAVALGLSSILLGQIGIVKGIGDSVLAFYAADAGIEEILMSRNNPPNISQTFLPNGASYEAQVTVAGTGDCPIDKNFCVKAIGTYLETRRAIQITY
jgi:Tfp pilus assembly protein PilX